MLDALEDLTKTIQNLSYMANTYAALKTFIYVITIVTLFFIFIVIGKINETKKKCDDVIKKIDCLENQNKDLLNRIEQLNTRIDNLLINKNN